ncbi:hypothetical protein BCR34DRAFT_578844 [Clohesyomyces aquaticus]|uniref:Uncharacterized protein n=1 Tax=Clohesyomyces aquaticus TaxID=1231657 RepID=A0A1Y1YDX3_9PLEO|nr:hypothetical protein BCR34DRAFT_578844 [Clohesyomyces aquaticus]
MPMSQPGTITPFPFFSLPRELRNLIYTHLFTSTPYLPGSFFSLPFSLYYGNRCCAEPYYWRYRVQPRWLVTSKTFMTEALEEYKREAEWIYWGPGMDHLLHGGKPRNDFSGLAIRIPGMRRSSFPISIATNNPPRIGEPPIASVRIRRWSLHIGNLAWWETPSRSEGTDGREVLGIIANTIQRASDKVPDRIIELGTLRLQGRSTHLMHEVLDAADGVPTCYGQTKHMFRNMKKVLDGAGGKMRVRKWEFEILNEGIGVLFEVEFRGRVRALGEGEEEEFDLKLVVDDRKWKEPVEHLQRVHTHYCKEQKRAKFEREKRRRETEALRDRQRAEEKALLEASKQ